MSITYLWRVFKIATVLIFLIVFVRTFIVEPGKVDGVSMETNFIDNELFLVNKFALLFSPPERGQVIQIHREGTEHLVIKRVIGLPGETVTIKQNAVFISNGTEEWKLSEPYLDDGIRTRSASKDMEVYGPMASDEYFLLGDNRPNSIDSRYYGLIPRSWILGSVVLDEPVSAYFSK